MTDRLTQGDVDLAVLERAVDALIRRGVEAGRAALSPIAGQVWLEKIRLAPVVEPRALALGTSVGSRSFSATRSAQVLTRDGFTCRYCGCRIVPRRLLVALSAAYPQELPYYTHYKRGTVHRVYWTLAAEADHLVAGSQGGDWRDPTNHVTACVYCNTQKSSRTLAEIGWTLRAVSTGEWDGLTSRYRPLWEAVGRPDLGYHRPFINALHRART